MTLPDRADGWSHWPAPAKLNLFLHVTGRRADGYHTLQTVFRLLDWGDTVALRPTTDGVIRRIGEGAPGVAAPQDLLVHAAIALQNAVKTPKGADIVVEKRIPAGGGLGGGSSDAATVLVALDCLWGTRLGVEKLVAIGATLGADVPVFVHGRNAWAEGIGDRLHPIELPPAWYLLVSPGVHASTAELFADPGLTRDTPAATIVDFAAGHLEGNAFEPVLRRRQPAVDAVFRALQGHAPRLTGSGSTVFVECASRAQAEALRDRLPAGFGAWVAQGAGRSPLLDAVEQYTPGASPSG